MTIKYPVYKPYLSGNEKKYVNECLDSSWISSQGEYVDKFEKAFAEYIGIKHALSCSNGTTALHLALLALQIGPGDEVIVPSLTYVASANAIVYAGATPVFADSEPEHFQIDPKDIEAKITSKTKAILVVHLYGHAANMDAITNIAKKHNLFVIEDCAEAIGTKYNHQFVGTLGDVATFSFFGNKTITTGEGGMVVTSNKELAEKIFKLKGQGVSRTKRYFHDVIGYNYRMTNIAAAIGLAQFERLDEILAMKREIAARYRELMADLPVSFQALGETTVSSEWLVSLLLPAAANRDAVMEAMQDRKVETRPVFYCAHQMPAYAEMARGLSLPVAEEISARGMSLPSYPGLTMRDQVRVVSALRDALAAQGIS